MSITVAKFRDVAGEFVDFSRGCEWIIHNAAFDVAFFDYEFDLCGFPRSHTIYGKLIDTLALEFDLDAVATRVMATLAFRRNPDAAAG